jgi:hypothetical protein
MDIESSIPLCEFELCALVHLLPRFRKQTCVHPYRLPLLLVAVHQHWRRFLGDPEEPSRSNPSPSEDVLRATPSLADSARVRTSWSKHRPCQAPRREFRRGVGRNPSSRTSWDSPVVVRDVALEATYRQCKGHHVRQGSDGHYVKNTRHRVRNTCNWHRSTCSIHATRCDVAIRAVPAMPQLIVEGAVSCTAAGTFGEHVVGAETRI